MSSLHDTLGVRYSLGLESLTVERKEEKARKRCSTKVYFMPEEGPKHEETEDK